MTTLTASARSRRSTPATAPKRPRRTSQGQSKHARRAKREALEASAEKEAGWVVELVLPLLRWTAPIAALLLYLQAAEVLVDAGWLPLLAGVFLAPAYLWERRKADAVALGLLVLGAAGAAALSGLPAAGVACGAMLLGTLISAPGLFLSALVESLG